MQCQKCQALNDDASKFCEQCGQPLQVPKQQQTSGLLKFAAGVGIAALTAWQLSQRQKTGSQQSQQSSPKQSQQSSPQQAESENPGKPTGKVMTCGQCGYNGPTREEKIMRHLFVPSVNSYTFYPGTVYHLCARCGEILN